MTNIDMDATRKWDTAFTFRKHLLNTLDSIRGPIRLVIEPSFVSVLGACVADASTLKQHGVAVFSVIDASHDAGHADQSAEWTDSSADTTVVYLIHGTVESGARAARHAGRMFEIASKRPRAKNGRIVEVCVVSFPRVLDITKAMFERQQVHEAVFVGLPCAWVPLADDVLSLEYDDAAVRELFVNQLNSSLPYDIAYALYSGRFGMAATVQAKGRLSCKVAEMLRRMRREAGRGLAVDDGEHGGGAGGGELELILIDRSVDMVTPMCTQLTYEGLLDEVFGMRYGQIKADVKVSGLTDDDPVFKATRNTMFPGARAWVNAGLREIQQFRDQQMAGADVSALRGFVSNLRDNFSRMSQHASLLEKLGSRMVSPTFAARQRLEASMLEDGDVSPLHDVIYRNDGDLTSLLRLMCLQCAVGGGIPKREFDVLRKEVLNTYGFQHIEVFERLQEAGVLYEKEDRTKRSAFAESKAKLKLLVEDASRIDAQDPEDMHFAYAGYAPWSCRLVEDALYGAGWQTRLDGSVPTIRVRQAVAEDGSARDTVITDKVIATEKGDGNGGVDGGGERARTRNVMVMFIGGVTAAEISALRWMATRRGACRLLVGCTGVVNGSRLLKSLM